MRIAVVSAVVVFMFCPGVSRAQTLYGSLVGSVIDAAGAAIPGATIETTSASTGLAKKALTDERGAYLFNDLQPGAYTVKVTAPSFASFTKTGVQVSINTIVRVDVQLQVGA